MSYQPFKSVGVRTFTDISGPGTLETVGATTLEAPLDVAAAMAGYNNGN